MTPKDIVMTDALDRLAQRGVYHTPTRTPMHHMTAPARELPGMGENLFEKAAASALEKVTGGVTKLISLPAGVKPPGEMYAEAAPRIQSILKQYDKASPGIDFLIDNWMLTVVAAFTVGVAAGFAANGLYDLVKKRR